MASAPAVAPVDAPAAVDTPTEAPRGVAVRFTDVSKTFRIPVDRPYTLKERVLRPRSSRAANDLEALQNVSFEIEKGEFFGIIGRNGSGKSTLLKCLAGIYQPTSGKIEIAGRISPFLELGVGFSPELTARENVVLNASLIGISPKIARASFDDIIAFAELEEFVDLKFKNYSSGMMMRLAFASAIQADTDILLIDEALAVGDEPFKEKCYVEFERMKDSGRTIIFVSHALALVNRFCDRAMLLDKGEFIQIGPSREVVATYQQRNRERAEAEKAKLAAAEAVGDSAPKPVLVAEAAPPPVAAVPVTPAPPPAPAAAPPPEAKPAPPPEAKPAPEPAPSPEAKPAPAPPPAPVQPDVAEPATQPNVLAPRPITPPAAPKHTISRPTPRAPTRATPPQPEAAATVAAWVEDGQGGQQRMSDAIEAGTLHIRASFPDATQEPVFGAIVKGATGEAIRVNHTLQDDLRRGGGLEADAPFTVRFYVHAGRELYVASVAVRPSPDKNETAAAAYGALAFSVFGTRLRANSSPKLLTDAPGTQASAPLPLAGTNMETIGDAWIEGLEGERDRVFAQRNDGTLHATIAMLSKTPKPAELLYRRAASRAAPYTIKLYAYTDTGHYATSIAITPRGAWVDGQSLPAAAEPGD